MTESTATACLRCRKQKLKCSRERPECARCARLGALCSYPAPPDRKLLASKRAATRRRYQSTLKVPEDGLLHNTNDSSKRATDQSSIVDETSKVAFESKLPGRDIQELLQDLYFTCTFNASLMFHRPTFRRQWAKNELPQSVLMAVCAMGTVYLQIPIRLFLTESVVLSTEMTSNLPSINDLQASGRQWALASGKSVLTTIDEPTLSGIQTCAVLALYWFAVGERPRNAMFSGIAYRGMRELKATVKGLVYNRDRFEMATEMSSQRISSEMLNRCFWSTWIQNCINSDHYVTGTSADNEVMTIPLPIDEGSFEQEIPVAQTNLSDTLATEFTSPRTRDSKEVSVMAEIVRMVFYWIKVRDHIEARKRVSIQDSLADLFALDQTLLKWASALPSKFAYSKRNLYEQLVIKQQPCYSVVHTVFHQCRLVLHSSLVPQFSGAPLHDNIPLEVVRMSARTAIESAKAISGIGADLVALEWNPAQLAPFFGYCLYVSASVHIAFIFSKQDELATAARSGLLSNLQLLKSTKAFWKHQDRLWERVHLLYEANAKKATSTRGQYSDVISDPCSSVYDVDDIAFIKRETGSLTEPLAESVLQYGLQGLQTLSKSADDFDGSRSLRELENAFQTDRMAQITITATSRTLPVSIVTKPASNGDGPTVDIVDQTMLDEPVNPQGFALPCPIEYHLAGFGPNFASDWFDPDMEYLPSVFSSCDNLFDDIHNEWNEDQQPITN